MKLAWLTDIHLNFLDDDARMRFYQKIAQTNCEHIVITGDIAEAPSLENILKEMANAVKKPIYFVLGNHDYYKGSIVEVKKQMSLLSNNNRWLNWLPACGIKVLDKNIILLGQDDWADGRLGDYQNSRISLNDSRLILELFQQKILGKYQLVEKMQRLADEDAKELYNDLIIAIQQHNPNKVIVLTHVPPFKEVCLHEGKISNADWLPYFSSKATGDVLLKIAEKNPTIDFLVLCGHTHCEANYQPLNNLIVRVGKAEYFQPEVHDVINL